MVRSFVKDEVISPHGSKATLDTIDSAASGSSQESRESATGAKEGDALKSPIAPEEEDEVETEPREMEQVEKETGELSLVVPTLPAVKTTTSNEALPVTQPPPLTTAAGNEKSTQASAQ